jgi:hypothetical protein
MTSERQIAEHLERALVETVFAIAEFDGMRAESRARGEFYPQDTLAGMLLMLRSALDSAVMLTREFTPAERAAAYSLAGPDSRR